MGKAAYGGRGSAQAWWRHWKGRAVKLLLQLLMCMTLGHGLRMAIRGKTTMV